MPKLLYYGESSKKALSTVDTKLAEVFEKVINVGLIDVKIIQGRRSKIDQDDYFKRRKSKVEWPNSKHNVLNATDLALAIDAAPIIKGRISWNKAHCIYLAGIVLTVAYYKGVIIRWGGNWDMDREPITDQDFQDLCHYEIKGAL